MKSTKPNIVVIGSGVIGLTLSYLLLKSNHYNVTIVAEYIPPCDNVQYTSAHAGAIWRSFGDEFDQDHIKYDEFTFNYLLQLQKELGLNHLIKLISVFEGFENSKEFHLPWFKDLVPNFKLLQGSELPDDIDKGFQYDTICINTPEYLTWLKDQVIQLGGKFIQTKLNHLSDCLKLVNQVNLIVNCTGLGYTQLNIDSESELQPMRGQTLLVHAPQLTKNMVIYPDGKEGKEEYYIILRGNGNVILGGVMQPNNWSTEYDHQTEESVLKGCIKYHPELTSNNFKILKRNVGFRPSRKSGIRIESKHLVGKNNEKLPLIHFYGHGGAGYQSSWGSSMKVLNLINSKFQIQTKL